MWSFSLSTLNNFTSSTLLQPNATVHTVHSQNKCTCWKVDSHHHCTTEYSRYVCKVLVYDSRFICEGFYIVKQLNSWPHRSTNIQQSAPCVSNLFPHQWPSSLHQQGLVLGIPPSETSPSSFLNRILKFQEECTFLPCYMQSQITTIKMQT